MTQSLADLAVSTLALVSGMDENVTNESPERHQIRNLKRHAQQAISDALHLALNLTYQAKDLTKLMNEVKA